MHSAYWFFNITHWSRNWPLNLVKLTLEYKPGHLYSSIAILQRQTGPGQWIHVRRKWLRRCCNQLCFGLFDPKTRHCVGIPHPRPHDSCYGSSGRMADEGESPRREARVYWMVSREEIGITMNLCVLDLQVTNRCLGNCSNLLHLYSSSSAVRLELFLCLSRPSFSHYIPDHWASRPALVPAWLQASVCLPPLAAFSRALLPIKSAQSILCLCLWSWLPSLSLQSGQLLQNWDRSLPLLSSMALPMELSSPPCQLLSARYLVVPEWPSQWVWW